MRERKPKAERRDAGNSSHKSRNPKTFSQTAQRQDPFRSTIDFGIIATLIGTAILLGGRHDLGRLVFVVGVGFTTTAWLVSALREKTFCWRWTGMEWLCLFSVLIVAVQIVPLPSGWLKTLSPNIESYLPAWGAESGGEPLLKRWQTLSLTPSVTRSSLVMLIAFWTLFFVVAQQVKEKADIEKIFRWISISCIAMAILGLVQRFLGSGEFMWFYEHPFRTTNNEVTGPFINSNHFASYLALGVPALIWWLQSLNVIQHANFGQLQRADSFGKQEKSTLLMILLGGFCIVIFAGLLSFSRGGIIVICLAAGLAVAGFAKAGLFGSRAVYSLGAAIFVVMIGLTLFGFQEVSSEMSTVSQASSLTELSSGRVEIWNAMLSATAQFPGFGTGASSLRSVHPIFLDSHNVAEYTYGESGFLQILMETGAVGFVCLLLVILSLARKCLPGFWDGSQRAKQTLMIVVASGLVASAVHSIFDFVWYIPACMMITVLLMACAVRIWQLDDQGVVRGRQTKMDWPVRVVFSTAVLGMLAMLVQQRNGPGVASLSWDRYVLLSQKAKAQEMSHITQAGSEDKLHREAMRMAREMRGHLRHVLVWNPNDALACQHLSSVDLRLFELEQNEADINMPLSQIRDVLQSISFANEEERSEWLEGVLGERLEFVHESAACAQQSMRLSPCNGTAYLYLADTAAFNELAGVDRTVLFEQAIKVRPYDGVVLYKLGVEQMQQGDLDAAMLTWQRAFDHSSDVRSIAMQSLAPVFPAEEIIGMVGGDIDCLDQLYRIYRHKGDDLSAQLIGPQLVVGIEQRAEENDTSNGTAYWNHAAWIHEFLGDSEAAVQCAKEAVKNEPTNIEFRVQLAGYLMDIQQYGDAIEHLKWVQRRRPNHQQATEKLEEAYRQNILRVADSKDSVGRGTSLGEKR